MRKDTTFSDVSLSVESFSDKYWLNGEVPYQPHSMQIADGRDEREQLIINNLMHALNEISRIRLALLHAGVKLDAEHVVQFPKPYPASPPELEFEMRENTRRGSL